MYIGKCAECNAGKKNKKWRSLRNGYLIPPGNQRALHFLYESEENNRICKTCYMKNAKELKKRKEEEDNDILLPPKVIFFVKLKEEYLLKLIFFQEKVQLEVVNGFLCKGCGYKTGSQSSVSKHDCREKGSMFARKMMKLKYFAVGKERKTSDDWILVGDDDFDVNVEGFQAFQDSLAALSGRKEREANSVDPWIDCENELLQSLGWTQLDEKKRKKLADLIVSLPKQYHLLPKDLKSYLEWFEIKLSEVTQLSSVCRWIAASNGKKSSKSLWRMPEVEETLKRRKKRFIQLCSFASQSDNNIDKVKKTIISYHFRIVFHTQLV